MQIEVNLHWVRFYPWCSVRWFGPLPWHELPRRIVPGNFRRSRFLFGFNLGGLVVRVRLSR